MQTNRPDVQVLDAREHDEWIAGRIDGGHADLLGELDGDRPIVKVCRSGGRAGKAAEFVSSAGLKAEAWTAA